MEGAGRVLLNYKYGLVRGLPAAPGGLRGFIKLTLLLVGFEGIRSFGFHGGSPQSADWFKVQSSKFKVQGSRNAWRESAAPPALRDGGQGRPPHLSQDRNSDKISFSATKNPGYLDKKKN
jgi:hypothetical protein